MWNWEPRFIPKLKIISGKDLIKIFEIFGFAIASQKGSHIKLLRIFENNRQTLTIPNHKEINKDTLKAIYNQALRYIPEIDLRSYFYFE
jgi:predicted RNA binding protein YcfA (HicA-like mRNA interferase family)